MSTRCSTIFLDGDDVVASIYRHHDGYPEGEGKELVKFLAALEQLNAQPGPYQHRYFESPGQLAAWWVAQRASVKADSSDPKRLDVEICGDHTHGDIAYRYEVLCLTHGKSKPRIRVFERVWDDETREKSWNLLTEDLSKDMQP